MGSTEGGAESVFSALSALCAIKGSEADCFGTDTGEDTVGTGLRRGGVGGMGGAVEGGSI